MCEFWFNNGDLDGPELMMQYLLRHSKDIPTTSKQTDEPKINVYKYIAPKFNVMEWKRAKYGDEPNIQIRLSPHGGLSPSRAVCV